MRFWMMTFAAFLLYSRGAAADETPAQMQQLVAPIALYPDELVAQVLAASTQPGQVVQANRWLQQHSNLRPDQLAQEVDKQPWDPSVRALTQFPSVLANLDKNLSWTTELGETYANQQQAVLDAVQVMRRRAQSAGTLKTTPQQTVTSQGETVVIEPTNPEVVYVPAYDPWLVYGDPLLVYPGWVPWGGPFFGVGIGFGFGFRVGFFGRFGWGFHHWGFDWRERRVFFNHSPFFAHRGPFFHSPGFHGGPRGWRPGATFPRGQARMGSGFHGGFHGGGFHGGGFHGGGFHGGGGHR